MNYGIFNPMIDDLVNDCKIQISNSGTKISQLEYKINRELEKMGSRKFDLLFTTYELMGIKIELVEDFKKLYKGA
jgi:hypothetical protein